MAARAAGSCPQGSEPAHTPPPDADAGPWTVPDTASTIIPEILRKSETVARAPGCLQKTVIVKFGFEPLSQEGNTMFGPGEYRPDPSAGITAPADLPQPEIVPYNRNAIRHPCPCCGHSAYRDKQSHRTLHDLGKDRKSTRLN